MTAEIKNNFMKMLNENITKSKAETTENLMI
jgi:hypothetical protein